MSAVSCLVYPVRPGSGNKTDPPDTLVPEKNTNKSPNKNTSLFMDLKLIRQFFRQNQVSKFEVCFLNEIDSEQIFDKTKVIDNYKENIISVLIKNLLTCY